MCVYKYVCVCPRVYCILARRVRRRNGFVLNSVFGVAARLGENERHEIRFLLSDIEGNVGPPRVALPGYLSANRRPAQRTARAHPVRLLIIRFPLPPLPPPPPSRFN